MEKSHFVSSLVFVLLFCLIFHKRLLLSKAARTEDGSEAWGYVEVRPKAHMFWWYYRSPLRIEDPKNPWPIILWLQGGPGSSGVGFGNFVEIGPLDTYLKPRNSTWLTKADLLFVDSPVGTGYSYVEDPNLHVKTDEEAASDLTTLLIEVFNTNETLQNSHLYIVAESYGGKLAVILGLSALKAIESRKLKLKLGGIALGDSWTFMIMYISWGPLLKQVSRLAEEIEQQLKSGKFEEATDSWSHLEDLIHSSSNGVDIYNFLLGVEMDPVISAASQLQQKIPIKRNSSYLNALRRFTPGGGDNLNGLMNGEIKKKLKIIPNNVVWGAGSDMVFETMAGDFMRSRIDEVDQLLAKGVNVTVLVRQDKVKGFTKSYKKFHFYWILGAGHFVPVDQPCVTLSMIERITQSPVASVVASN